MNDLLKHHESPELVISQERLKTFTMENFWTSLQEGKFRNLTQDEIKNLAEFQISSFQPLTPLTDQERTTVRDHFASDLNKSINNEKLRRLVEGNFAYIETGKYPKSKFKNFKGDITVWDKVIIFKDAAEYQFLDTDMRGTLSQQDKARLFSDPDVWFDTKAFEKSLEYSLTRQGNRSLFDLEYGYRKKERFIAECNALRKSTGHNKLKIMDLGGGMGRALWEAKTVDPNIETYNVTIYEEPAMYPVDHLIVSPAEWMPAELKEQIDLILSRTAFRYFTYPDVAIKNVVKSLSVKGGATIDFTSYRSALVENSSAEDLDTKYKELCKRVSGAINWLKDLEFKGFIVTNLGEMNSMDPADAIHLVVKKLKSIKQAE